MYHQCLIHLHLTNSEKILCIYPISRTPCSCTYFTFYHNLLLHQVNKENYSYLVFNSLKNQEWNNINWVSRKCKQGTSQKMWVMTETTGYLNSHPKFLCNVGALHLQYTRLVYLSDLSVKEDILKGCSSLSWQCLTVTFFCVLLVQLGQHIVSTRSKDFFFLPILCGLLLPQRK